MIYTSFATVYLFVKQLDLIAYFVAIGKNIGFVIFCCICVYSLTGVIQIDWILIDKVYKMF